MDPFAALRSHVPAPQLGLVHGRRERLTKLPTCVSAGGQRQSHSKVLHRTWFLQSDLITSSDRVGRSTHATPLTCWLLAHARSRAPTSGLLMSGGETGRRSRRFGGHGCKDTGNRAGTAQRTATRRGCGGGAVSDPVRPMRCPPRGRRAAPCVAPRPCCRHRNARVVGCRHHRDGPRAPGSFAATARSDSDLQHPAARRNQQPDYHRQYGRSCAAGPGSASRRHPGH